VSCENRSSSHEPDEGERDLSAIDDWQAKSRGDGTAEVPVRYLNRFAFVLILDSMCEIDR